MIGCSSDDDKKETGSAQLRVIHLSPDAPAVDVWANGSLRAIERLDFASGTEYLTLDAGTYDFAVSAAGE